MNPGHGPLPGCPIPSAGGDCLPECRAAGTCRAGILLLADGRIVHGRALGILGDTLRFHSVYPVRGPLLLPFTETEALSLHDCLRTAHVALDAPTLRLLAEAAAARGLVDLALRDLDRASGVAGADESALRACRERILRDAACRALKDALDHLAARRYDHARAALDEVLHRFPETESASEARRLRRTLVGGAA